MKTLTLQPDWTAGTTSFKHTWEGVVNIDQFRWMARRDVQEQLKLAHAELGARHVRAVGMLDDEMRVLERDPVNCGTPNGSKRRVNWQLVDYVVDSLLDIGINPMFTTTFMPGHMAAGERTVFSTRGRISLPKDWSEWRELVADGTRHMIDRYGLEVVRNWYFEVWNEPNLENAFFEGNQDDFHKLWAETYRAVKEVDASLRVGGPSAARGDWVLDLLEFGRQNGCEPDYIITHVYNNDSEWAALSPFDGPQEDRASKSPHFAAGVMRGVRRELDKRGFKGEVHWNEWGRSWLPHDPMRETANEAAFIAKTMSEVSQLADYYAYWCLSDVYDQVGYGRETFHGNYGLLNLQGLRKPAYHAFQLLGLLGEERVPISGEGLDALTGAIATKSDKGEGVLLYSFDETLEAGVQQCEASVALSQTMSQGKLRLYRINSRENNVLTQWREMGAPAYLKREQLSELQSNNTLQSSADAVTITNENGVSQARFSFEAPGVALLLCER
jgi:xylan 1,4-beta-xylosidase